MKSFRLLVSCSVPVFIIVTFAASLFAIPAGSFVRPAHASAITRFPVLMYHYISAPPNKFDTARLNLSVEPALFDQQMQWLSTHGYTTITADQAVAALVSGAGLPAHAVLLTFDDGYTDAYTNAYATLHKYHLVGTFFVVTDWVDQGRSGYLSWENVREMNANGMSIGGHSLTHETLTGPDTKWLSAEINNSLVDIQKQIGRAPAVFAYPYGSYDHNTLDVIKSSMAHLAFTTTSRAASSAENPYAEPRIRVNGGTTAASLAALLHSFGF